MPKALRSDQVSSFNRLGFTFPIPVLTPEETASYGAQCGELERRLGAHEVVWRRMPHVHFQWAYDLATHPAILDAVEEVLGADVLVLSTILFSKQPNDGRFVSWHQDGRPFVRTGEPMEALTAWIALSDSTPENGCLRVIPGSHQGGYLPHGPTPNPGNMLRYGDTVSMDVNESRAVPIVLKAGEMSLHHVDVLHGSEPNRTNQQRVGFTIRYTSAVVQTTSSDLPRVVARGKARPELYPLFTGQPQQSMEAGMASLEAGVAELLAREASAG